MATNFMFRSLSSPCYFSHPRNRNPPISRPCNPSLLFPSKQRSRVSISYSIKDKGDVSDEEAIRILTTQRSDNTSLQVEDAEDESPSLVKDREGRNIDIGYESFEWKWPPWKHLPQRYKLISATSLAFVICNMDKVNLSVAIIPMSHQFGWNASMAGLVQSCFFWGYALSQLPGGWLAKIFGGRDRWEVVRRLHILAWVLCIFLLI